MVIDWSSFHPSTIWKTLERDSSGLKSKTCSAVLLSSSFYALQLLSQRFFALCRIHAGMPKVLTSTVGLTSVAVNLALCQFVEYTVRDSTNNFGFGEQRKSAISWFPNARRVRKDVIKDQLSRLCLSFGVFFLLEQSTFRTALPSSVIMPGVYTNSLNRLRRSIPATSDIVTEVERRKIQLLGRRYGCHQCGNRQLFRREVFIGDHMPPTKFAKEMSDAMWRKFLKMPVQQRLWAQCQDCFRMQGSAVRAGVHKLVFHNYFRRHHLAPAIAFGLSLEETVQKTVNEAIDPLVVLIDSAVNK